MGAAVPWAKKFILLFPEHLSIASVLWKALIERQKQNAIGGVLSPEKANEEAPLKGGDSPRMWKVVLIC